MSRASFEINTDEPTAVPVRRPQATEVARGARRATPSRRRWQIARRLLGALLVGIVLSWGVAAVLCWTIDPRRGTVRTSESWQASGTSLTAQLWDGPASRYAETVRARGYKRPWGTEQVVGDPDTHGTGDIQTAWAPATPDGQAEWLKLKWSRPVEAREICIYQTYNAGAIDRVSVALGDGKEETIWSALDSPPGSFDQAVFTIPLKPGQRIDRVTISIDSPRVPGWNEIDAVCLKDAKGVAHGADDAAASSTYAERNAPAQTPLTLPDWPGVGTESAAFARGDISYEHRAAGAFGWPLAAWVASQTVESGQQQAASTPGMMPGMSGGGGNWPVSPTGRGVTGPMRAIPFRPILPAVLVNAALYLAVLWVLQLVLLRPLRPLRRLVRMQRGQCLKCGYDLRYDFAGGCPECGALRDDAGT